MADFITGSLAWIEESITVTTPNFIISHIPLIIQLIGLVIAGYIVGKVIKLITVKFLGVVGLKRATSRTWTDVFLRAAGYRGNFVELIGDLIKWLVYILFIAIIIQTLGLPGLADIFTQIATFMPRFIGAILIVVVGLMIADFFGKIFEEAGSRFLNGEVMGKISGGLIKYSISLVIIAMALSLLGIDTGAILILLAAFFGIIIVVFGLGIKDVLPNFTAGLQIKTLLRPGETIRFDKYSGEVVKVDALSTTIQTKNSKIEIPNSIQFKQPIENLGKK